MPSINDVKAATAAASAARRKVAEAAKAAADRLAAERDKQPKG